MGARVTIRVALPPNQPVEGAEVTGVNHDAWSSSHRTWRGRTDADGTFTWANLDTGTLGDRYTFAATYTDPDGVSWAGSVSERINRPLTLKLILTPTAAGSSSISADAKGDLDSTQQGRRLLASLTELASVVDSNLVQSALLLEASIVEMAIRMKLERDGQFRGEWDHLSPSVLLSFKQVDDSLGPKLVERVRALYAERNRVVHGPGKDSVPALAQRGRETCIAVVERLFGPRGSNGT
jgi:hypothetical protein